MKNKLLLFMAALVAGGLMLMPQQARADISTNESFDVVISTAAAWNLTPSSNTITLTSQHFNWTGGPAQTANHAGVNFGDDTVPTSYIITNDTGSVDDYTVTMDITAEDDTTAATFVDADTIQLVNAGVATIQLDCIKQSTGASPPEIGDLAFAVIDGDTLDTSVAQGGGSMTVVDSNKFGLDLKLDVDQSTLTEADGPCTLGFQLTFTLATVAP